MHELNIDRGIKPRFSLFLNLELFWMKEGVIGLGGSAELFISYSASFNNC